MTLKYNPSAFKHKLTQAEIEVVLQSDLTEQFDEDWDENGRFCIMFVGFNANADLREVKVAFEVDPITDEITDAGEVVHADVVTPKYEQKWQEAKN